MRILAFLTDMPPLAGFPSSGTAVRTYGLCQGLRASGHEVIVCPPCDAVRGFEQSFAKHALFPTVKKEFGELKKRGFNPGNQAELIYRYAPDLVFCAHWPALMLQTKPRVPIVIDLAGPYLLERHYLGIKDHKGAVLAKLRVLSLADMFIVSGPSQADYFFSFMKRAGIHDAEARTCTITMPLSPELPRREIQDKNYPHFIFGGVFLPWQNPAWALLQLSEHLKATNRGQLSLIGGAHPNYPVNDARYEELFKSLSRNPLVRRKGMMPFDEFIAELVQANVAIDLMDWNLERQLAVTIRTTTYLWAGLPVIYNDYADLGALIAKYDAGWLVKPGAAEQLKNVIDEIQNKPELVLKKSTNARILANSEFVWDKAIKPLTGLLGGKPRGTYHETDVIIESREQDCFPLFGGRGVRQYFQCRVPNLKRVECLLNSRSRHIAAPVRLALSMVETTAATSKPAVVSAAKLIPLASREFAPDELAAQEWFSLDFLAQSDSAGQFYCLELFSLDNGGDKDKLVSPWVMKSHPYPMLDLFYAQQIVPHSSLCCRTIGG